MPIQVFVDDSGGKGHTRHLVLAGLIATAEEWAEFSDEWVVRLSETPAISLFKMRDAAGCNGQFGRFTEEQRDKKLRVLAKVVNQYAKIGTYSIIDIEAHSKTWAMTNSKPVNEPYFWPFHNSIMAAALELSELGLTERFEIMFDEHAIFGPRAKSWYPIVRAAMKLHDTEAHAIMPIDPVFRTDDEALPLQAADLFAWCWRRGCDIPTENHPFEWLLGELSSINISRHSQYYDHARISAVEEHIERNLKGRLVPSELIQAYKEAFGD